MVGDDSAVDADVAVAGLRRGSWRRFETPESLVNDELDLPYFELLFEKLCLIEFAFVNILAPFRGQFHWYRGVDGCRVATGVDCGD